MIKHLSIIVLLFTISSFSQSNNQSTLSLDEIMKGNEFIGHQPENIEWSDDSQTIYFNWNPDNNPIASLYKYSISTQKIDKVSVEEEKLRNDSYDYDFNEGKSQKVFVKNGDIFISNVKTGETSALVKTFSERESNVSFSANEEFVVFNKDDNVFKMSLLNGSIEQLTNIKSGSPSDEKPENDQDEWLKDQQEALFEVLRDRKERTDLKKAHSDLLKVKKPKAIYLEGKSISSLNINNNGNYATYKLSTYATNKRTIVPHFVSESGYTEDQKAYAKVGAKQDSHDLWIFDFERDSTYQVNVLGLSGIYDKPLYLKDYDTDFTPKYEEPKAVNFVSITNSPNDKNTIVELRSLDNKDRWFARIDFVNGKLVEVNHQHDEAWIGGPGITGWNISGNYGWLDDSHVWYHSEKTGYAHLYKTNVISGKEKPLTKGKWEVHNAELSDDYQSMYITTNQDHPGERQLYKLDVNTLKSVKLTGQVGNNEVSISPNEQYFAIRQSFSNKPWELYLLKNEEGATETQLTESTTSEFKNYDWKIPENITFKAADGVEVAARLYQPEGGSNGKPTVVFVHGAGYLQNAHKWWSGYYHEYLFHNYLVDNGYVVLDIDYRASKGYGRDYRTAIYRHMGGKDLSDQVDGVQHLVEKYGVDKDNVGIYGGSYGGFISIMGMFNAPETFKSGAAIRSVTDWAHYHHAYTSNILNTPVSDPTAYQKSSPINFAEGLEGNLLMLHGMIDDNVHFQDVVRLTQRLIELKKENFEMAIYPLERHGFIESSSWRDEYKRIYKLFQRTLKE
ncbi:MAG: prolyl oligopeptidase family serine peptidase [Urechidicola sp.]